MPEPRPQQINVALDEKVAEGIYANLALISHGPAEFFIDFARMVPGVQKANVQARVIMTPAHVKFLAKALNDNLEKFEKQFGEIKLHGQQPSAGSFGFRSQQPENK